MARFYLLLLAITVLSMVVQGKTLTAEPPTGRKLGNGKHGLQLPTEGPYPGENATVHRHHHHHHEDKSVAGGVVILGGLGTVFLVAVFCYIRATRRKPVEPLTPTASPVRRKPAADRDLALAPSSPTTVY